MTHPKPSVDIGYPTGAHGRIPSFNNVEEEAEFWDTHSFTDFDDEFTPVEITVSKHLSAPLSVRIDARDRAEIDRQAQTKRVGPSTLFRMWVKKHLNHEAGAGSAPR